MKHYRKSDYAINKYSSGIVYKFVDQIIEITAEEFLAQNPEMTSKDFFDIKKLSDEIYRRQAVAEHRQTKLNIPLQAAQDLGLYTYPSAEIMLEIEELAREDTRILQATRRFLSSGLTERQRRRWISHYCDGASTREIARKECVHQKVVWRSINAANKKIKNFLEKGASNTAKNDIR